MKEEPPLSVECKDMFLVRSMLIPPEKAAILLADLVGPFLDSPASRLIQFSYVIVDHWFRDRKFSLSESKGKLFTPGRPTPRRGR